MSPSVRGSDKGIAVGGVPRADLLPPELKAEVKLRSQRRFMGFIVILSVALVVAGYLYATVQAAANGLRLEASNASTVTLTEQKNQYIEVTELQSQVTKNKAAQIVGVATEINWQKYLLLVVQSLPPGTLIGAIDAETSAPGAVYEPPTGPLLNPSIAKIEFVATSPTLPDVSQWIENLAKIPGYANATVGAITLTDDGKYEVNIVLYLNEEALENRFLETDEDDEDADDEAAESTEETTP